MRKLAKAGVFEIIWGTMLAEYGWLGSNPVVTSIHFSRGFENSW